MKRITLISVLVLCFSLAAMAASNDDRYNDLGVKIQCSCSCGQALIKCNHVGCTTSDKMISELRTALTNYANDEDVLNWFRRSYGMTVVVTPATHGFELLIWVVPPVLVTAGFLLVFFLIRRWRLRAAPVGMMRLDPRFDELRARARRETEL